jgi:hypothetical protein
MPGQGLGIAPIGHKVTVATATEVLIDISAEITVSGGYPPGGVAGDVEAAIGGYIADVRKGWGQPDRLNRHYQDLFISRISLAAMSVPGVGNIQSIKINNVAADMSLVENADRQELPVLGEVNIIAS